MLLVHWRPEVALAEAVLRLLLRVLRLLLKLLWRPLLNLLRGSSLRYLLNLLRLLLLQNRGGLSQDVGVVNDLALVVLVPAHVVAHDVVVPEHAEADGTLGVLLLKLGDLLRRDVAVSLDQMLVE